jgi:thymidylate kinase
VSIHSVMPLRAVSHDEGVPAAQQSVRDLVTELGEAGVRYCALRDPLEGEAQAHDFDLLVDQASATRCREWLHARGFVAAPGRSPFKMVMLRYRDGRTLCLDIHWQAVQYGIVYMDARRMLDRRVESEGIYHLSREDELLHLVVHNFLRKGPLRPGALQRIHALLQGPLDRAYLTAHLDSFGLTSAFDAAAAWVEVNHAKAGDARDVRARLFRAALLARPGNLPRYLSVRLRGRRLARRSGGFVALVGPDGCGKSTVIKTLVRRAGAIPTLKVDTTYLGPWGQMQLSWIPALRRAGIIPTTDAKLPTLADRRPGARRPPLTLAAQVKGYVFYTVLYLELVYRYMTSVFVNVRRGHWVVADRYITDLRYMYKERPIEDYGAIRRLLCALYPKPDLLIVLDNHPTVIVTRKQGLAAAQIERLRQSCREAARSYRHEVVTTNRPPDEIADYLLNRMLALRASKSR